MATKLVRIIWHINIIALLAFAPIALLTLIFGFAAVLYGNFSDKMVIGGVGYLVAVVAGALAYNKPYWFVVSLVGWSMWGIYWLNSLHDSW